MFKTYVMVGLVAAMGLAAATAPAFGMNACNWQTTTVHGAQNFHGAKCVPVLGGPGTCVCKVYVCSKGAMMRPSYSHASCVAMPG